MKKILSILLLGTLTFWGFISCEDDSDSQPVSGKVEWLDKELYYLKHVSKLLNSASLEYPSPWNVEDESTWKDIRVDTIIDEKSGKKYRVIGAMTIYLGKDVKTPVFMDRFEHMKELKILARSGAIIDTWYMPRSLTTFSIEKLDRNEPGFISLTSYRNNIMSLAFFYNLERLEVHGIEMEDVVLEHTYDTEIDLSDNCLTGNVRWQFCQFKKPIDLSDNNFTSINYDVNVLSKYPSIPNLQNNNIPIPEEWIKTEFWKENHEKFKGNPGYRPPEN